MKERFCCGQPIRTKRVAPSVSAPLHLILQAPSPASHEWKRVPGVKRLCQVCHLIVDGQGVRCKSCGLNAHPQCGSHYPANYNLNSLSDVNTITSISATFLSETRRHEINNFESRIKKLLQVPLLDNHNHRHGSEERNSNSGNSTRLSSSCGDSVAASTAIVVETATVSTETTRSESTITPGCEVGAAEPRLLLSSSASVPDSGYTGLLGEEGTVEEEDCRRRQCGGSADPQCGNSSADGCGGDLETHDNCLTVPRIHYVDGPLDGNPYALVKPLIKQKTPSSADSGISVDQMKDLDRLLSALVQEAESIPDIPYHAREDSLPFSYTARQVTGASNDKQLRRHLSSSSAANYHPHYSSTPVPTYSSSPHHYHQPNSAPANYVHVADFPVQTNSQQQRRYHQPNQSQQHLHVNIDDQILSPELGSSYSVPISQHTISVGSRSQGRTQSQQQQSLLRESVSSNNFDNYGSSSNNIRRLRSQSADSRRTQERDEDADEWLARQMQRLQQKRASRNTVKNDWLDELKRALPSEKTREQQNNDFRPSSSSRIGTGMSVGPRSNVSTGPYSSDDEEIDREVEMFQRGRKIQRHYSDNAYDRSATSFSSPRAASQQSNIIDTPGFPTCPPTPYLNRPVSPGKPPRSPKAIRRGHSSSNTITPTLVVNEYGSGVPGPSTMERSQTPVNPRPVFMVESEVKFARDLSPFWYKPNASREETIAALRYQPTGMFLIRNSNSFPGAYGLAIKVNDSTTAEESVRHFLIEPTKYGVRLRGSAVEPVFGSLSGLVYAHSVETLALPTTLGLPIGDTVLPTSQSQSTTAHLLTQGAACQLLFLGVIGVECVTGDDAVDRAVAAVSHASPPTIVSLRLSKQGLTLTDIFRQRFFRLHFPLTGISYAALDPRGRSIVYGNSIRKIFAVVARAPSAAENTCVVLSELEEGQPANAIVAFFQRVIAWQH